MIMMEIMMMIMTLMVMITTIIMSIITTMIEMITMSDGLRETDGMMTLIQYIKITAG